MLESEEAIQAVVNEAGTLATEEALKQFNTQGEAIEIEGNQWRSKGQEEKFYQTPYGEIQCPRHVYHHHGRGKTFCPLEQSARIIGSSTPRFAKQVSIKMACNAALDVQQDLLECQGRKISTSFLQNLSQKVAGIAEQTGNQVALRSAQFPAANCINSDQPGRHLYAPEQRRLAGSHGGHDQFL